MVGDRTEQHAPRTYLEEGVHGTGARRLCTLVESTLATADTRPELSNTPARSEVHLVRLSEL